jgi:hypothetical protein
MPLYYSDSTKSFYDTDNIAYPNLPSDLIELTPQQKQNLQYELNDNQKIIVLVDGVITLEDRKPPPETWETIRFKRDRLLEASDWTQLKDQPESVSIPWGEYRQELRDIPETYNDPNEVVWPIPPW